MKYYKKNNKIFITHRATEKPKQKSSRKGHLLQYKDDNPFGHPGMCVLNFTSLFVNNTLGISLFWGILKGPFKFEGFKERYLSHALLYTYMCWFKRKVIKIITIQVKQQPILLFLIIKQ